MMAERNETAAAERQAGPATPAHRYGAELANRIEAKWQDRWESERIFRAPNPGEEPPASDASSRAERPKQFVLDMFPYPSGAGLHVGHPLGYIATDIFARFQRMAGCNVLHAMGYDAFGLPAEQYAMQTGQHPRVTTEQNIGNMRTQLRRLGLGHDPRRSVATTDVAFYKWTQWIFLKIFNSWYDEQEDRARSITVLIDEFESGMRQPVSESANPHGASWAEMTDIERRRVVDSYRLAYVSEQPVNWCPALGTVLANEEVTAEGRSERGNHPVYKRPLKQWMMRITAYAERLLADLEPLDWPEPLKMMQRNWIGRSRGAYVDFEAEDARGASHTIKVFTTRPDTLFGATYMVLAPEHPLVDELIGASDEGVSCKRGAFPGYDESMSIADAVAAYRKYAAGRSDVDRQVETKQKTGVYLGATAMNPVSGEQVPVFVADYVLMGYGTGAIMAVPAHDERDFAFARQFDLPIRAVLKPEASELDGADPEDASTWSQAHPNGSVAINSANNEVSLNGLGVEDAKARIIAWLEKNNLGAGAINYKLRDWLFSRQRYWGEPFPIVYDEYDMPLAVPEDMLPVMLPEMEDFRPTVSEDADADVPEPPLGRAREWRTVTLDLGDGPREYRRELNTMPQWAGSCWYYLRYLDPENEEAFCDPAVERYWMLARTDGGTPAAGESFDPSAHNIGGVDLYVGGVEHAVLHLLYARFWHKVLFDLGHVSTPEPFNKLFNQGYIQAFAYTDTRGVYVEAEEVVEKDGSYLFGGEAVSREYGKMGKSLKNAVAPDEICRDYGADTLRLYEMYLGPLEASKPWNTRDIIGVHRFLQRAWRNFVDEKTGNLRVSDGETPEETKRALHKTIAGVRGDMATLGFNTAIAKLIELNNHLTQAASGAGAGAVTREVAEAFAKMLSPLAPHVAEELWERLGHAGSIAYEPFPEPDASLLVEEMIEIPVQIKGKVRGRITVAADADQETIEAAAMADEKVQAFLEGKAVKKVVVVPGRMVNVVV